jgi:hypothetical protein
MHGKSLVLNSSPFTGVTDSLESVSDNRKHTATEAWTAFRTRIESRNPACGRFALPETVLLNLGNLRSLACNRCHIQASATGTRLMNRSVVGECVAFVRSYEKIGPQQFSE